LFFLFSLIISLKEMCTLGKIIPSADAEGISVADWN